MAPKKGPEPPPVAPTAWKVVGGSASGGITVREGCKVTTPECSEKLCTGAIIQELEKAGDRIRYALLRGTGPATGWVSTTVKGKEILAPHQLRIWTICCGTRGDIQPFIALNLGLQKAGFAVSIWTNEDYGDFVRSYKLAFFPLYVPAERYIRQVMVDGGLNESSELTKTVNELKVVKPDATRLLVSAFSGKPVKGISFKDGVPPSWLDIAAKEPLTAGFFRGLADIVAGTATSSKATKADIERCKADSDKLQVIIDEAIAKEDPNSDPMKEESLAIIGMGLPSSGGTPEDTVRRTKARAKARADFVAAAEAAGGPTLRTREDVVAELEEGSKDLATTFFSKPLDVAFLFGFYKDDSLVKGLREAVDKDPPDMVMYSGLSALTAHTVAAYCKIPALHAMLQPSGIHMSDPACSWLDENAFQETKIGDPRLAEFATLAEARESFDLEADDERLEVKHLKQKMKRERELFEDILLKPHFDVTPCKDWSIDEFVNRGMTGLYHMVGFLSSIGSKRFVDLFGPRSKKEVATHTYTGFWIIDQKDQLEGPKEMFGGADHNKMIENFIAAGSKPAYIGWGSCVAARGKEWMCVLAVGALMTAKMRGIILCGWADLSFELLQEVVGPDDPGGLCAYAKKNILFIKKASQTWLFPKCSVLVIHGGVGTLACAWTSGVPLIVCPVWLDQHQNSFLNNIMQSGYPYGRQVDGADPVSLGQAIKEASENDDIRRGCQAVQFSMMRDKGVQVATKHVIKVISEDFPSGKWDRGFRGED